MAFAEPTFDTDLDVEGFTPTDAEAQNIAAEVDRIKPLVREFPLRSCTSILGTTVAAAIESGNYTKFRKAMFPIEESLRDRVGRWVQRYPQIQAKIGTRFTIADIVEETFMLAFDRYSHWHPEMFFGQWIETLIDPAMKAIAHDPEGELETISFQRTWNEM